MNQNLEQAKNLLEKANQCESVRIFQKITRI